MVKFDCDRMKTRRIKLGLSKSALAREANLHASTISQIELGRLNPYPGQIEKINSTLDRLESERVD